MPSLPLSFITRSFDDESLDEYELHFHIGRVANMMDYIVGGIFSLIFFVIFVSIVVCCVSRGRRSRDTTSGTTSRNTQRAPAAPTRTIPATAAPRSENRDGGSSSRRTWHMPTLRWPFARRASPTEAPMRLTSAVPLPVATSPIPAPPMSPVPTTPTRSTATADSPAPPYLSPPRYESPIPDITTFSPITSPSLTSPSLTSPSPVHLWETSMRKSYHTTEEGMVRGCALASSSLSSAGTSASPISHSHTTSNRSSVTSLPPTIHTSAAGPSPATNSSGDSAPA